MRRLKSPALPALLLILCLALAACTAGGGQTTTDQPVATEEPTVEEPAAEEPTTEEEAPAEEPVATEETAAEEPAAEGERKIATFIWTQEFDTLSPLYTGMWFTTTTYALWNVWAWQFDENSNPIPVLVTEIPSAENGGISEDGRTITMTLRDDIVWSDGTPVTS